jgi:hypothetical protein
MEEPCADQVDGVCALTRDPSYAPNRIGIGSRGRYSNTFALSVRDLANGVPSERSAIDERWLTSHLPHSFQASV